MKIHDLGVPLFLETPIHPHVESGSFTSKQCGAGCTAGGTAAAEEPCASTLGETSQKPANLEANNPSYCVLFAGEKIIYPSVSNRNMVDKVLPKYHPDWPFSLPNSRFFFSYLWTFIFGTCLNNAAETLQLHQAECHPPKSQGKSSSATATTECETHHRRNSQGEVWSISPRLQEQLNCKTVLKCGETYGDVTVVLKISKGFRILYRVKIKHAEFKITK